MILEVKCARNMCFAYICNSLASQTSTAQNIARQCLSIVQKDRAIVSYFYCLGVAFVLLGADWLECWACEAWIGAPYWSSWISAAGDMCDSHKCTYICPLADRPNLGVFYVDRWIYWNQDVSVDPLFVCTSRRKGWVNWTHQTV